MKKVATSHSRRTTRLLALGTSLAVAIGLTATAAVAAPPTPPPSNNSPGSVPPWAGSRAKTGTPLSNTTVEGEIYLNLPDAGAAKAFATAVSTPGNAHYQQYLSPADWIAKYGPAKADVTALVDYLKAQGMVITSVPASGLYVVFRGTVAQINAAFSTTEQTYAVPGPEPDRPVHRPLPAGEPRQPRSRRSPSTRDGCSPAPRWRPRRVLGPGPAVRQARRRPAGCCALLELLGTEQGHRPGGVRLDELRHRASAATPRPSCKAPTG